MLPAAKLQYCYIMEERRRTSSRFALAVAFGIALVILALVLSRAGATLQNRSATRVNAVITTPAPTPTMTVAITIDPDDPVLGDEQAAVTIIEFADFASPAGKTFHETIFPLVRDTYVKTGKARYVFKHFPLIQIHPAAQSAAVAAQCAAAAGKFWEYADSVFAHSTEITDEHLWQYAQDLGVDTNSFRACVARADRRLEVTRDQQAGIAAGITATPTLVINGYLLEGVEPLENYQQVIDRLLAPP